MVIEENQEKNKTENQIEEVSLTESEVWEVINFARAMNGFYYGEPYLSPDLSNAKLKELNLNPLQASADELETAMRNPKNSELQLRSFSQDFELQSMVYKRLISYLSNMLAFDVTYTSNAKPEDYKKPRYERDLEKVEEFLDNFSYKMEFRIAIREMLRNDAYFGVLRKIGERYILQELPPDYCRITGRWAHGFVFEFDMNWFTEADIDNYPDFFVKKYRELLNENKLKPNYKSVFPANDRIFRNNSQWVEVPPEISACFKLSPELITQLPYFIPLFNDLILQGLMRNLQKNLNMAAANRMIIGEVPMLNKEIKATVRDSIAVSPELLGRFLALVKSAIGDSVKLASAPLTNMRGIEFESDNDLYDSYLRTTLASSGINTNLIFSSSVKPNAIETQLSLNVDEQMMKAIYEQFEIFVNYQLSKITSYFRFKIEFEGSDFSIDRDARFEKAMTLFDKGIMLPQKIAASLGIKPSQLRKHMEEAEANEFISKITPPALEQQLRMMELMPEGVGSPTNPKNAESGEAGRPKKNIKDLGEEGQKTRETGSNVAKKGRI